MYNYIYGTITDIESNYITLDNNGIGYQIYTPNPYTFNMDTQYKVYIYQYVREEEITLYGFKSSEEKDMFLRLIDVKGLGCKMALPMLATDRKSTRLNSSHQIISYAVFCLKKKKT